MATAGEIQRCPRCEAVMHELDCLECLAYDRMRAANPVADHEVAVGFWSIRMAYM